MMSVVNAIYFDFEILLIIFFYFFNKYLNINKFKYIYLLYIIKNQ